MENAGQDPAGQQAQAGPQQAAGGSDGKDYKALYEDAVHYRSSGVLFYIYRENPRL